MSRNIWSVKDNTANLHVYRKRNNFTSFPPVNLVILVNKELTAHSHLILMSSSDTKTQIKCLGIYILIFYSNINTICQVKQPFFKLQELPLWTPETTNAYTFALLVKDKPKTRQCTSWIVWVPLTTHTREDTCLFNELIIRLIPLKVHGVCS